MGGICASNKLEEEEVKEPKKRKKNREPKSEIWELDDTEIDQRNWDKLNEICQKLKSNDENFNLNRTSSLFLLSKTYLPYF